MVKFKAFIALSLIALGYGSALAALSSQDRAQIPTWQLIVNPGFESGTAGWVASGGTFTTTSTAANVGSGLSAGSWDSSAASQTLTGAAITIPAGAYGRPAILSCNIQTPSGTATHKIQAYDGTNVLAESTIQSSTQYRPASVMFQMPGSGSIRPRLISVASNEPIIHPDDCVLQVLQGDVVVPVAQASFYGSVTTAGTASCNWTRTSNQSFASFSADADCPTPTVEGAASAPGTKIPAITFNNMAPGDYYFVGTGMFFASGTNQPCSFRFSDGTNHASAQVVFASGSPAAPVITGKISYSNSATRTIEVQATGRDGNFACDILANTATTTPFRIDVYRFPSSSEIAVRPDVAYSWGGIATTLSDQDTSLSGTGVWENADATNWATKTLLGAATAGTTSTHLSFKMPYLPAGDYELCANYSIGSLSGNSCHGAMYDGTNRIVSFADSNLASALEGVTLACGHVKYTSAQTNLEFSIQWRGNSSSSGCRLNGVVQASSGAYKNFYIKPVGTSIPALLLIGSVTSNSTGMERVERANITSPTTIQAQSGSWLTSVSNPSTGNYTLNFASGIFTSAPVCIFHGVGAERVTTASNTSTSSVTMAMRRVTPTVGDLINGDFSVICMGPR